MLRLVEEAFNRKRRAAQHMGRGCDPGGTALHHFSRRDIPILFGDKVRRGILPPTSLNGYSVGNCAEAHAVNSALNAGAKLENLQMITVRTTRKCFGEPKEACKNCTYAFRGRIKGNYSGWKN